MLNIFLISEYFVVVSSLFLLIFGAVMSRINKGQYEFVPFHLVGRITAIIIFIALIIKYYSFEFFYINEFIDAFYFSQGFFFDYLNISLALLVFFMALLIVLASLVHFYIFAEYLKFEYYVLLLLSICGITIMSYASNFLIFYLGMELQTFVFYIFSAFKRYNVRSIEASIKYFILGAVASAFYLFGVSIVYGLTGSIDLGVISVLTEDLFFKSPGREFYVGLIIGFVFILSALFFKLSIFPFHFWVPDIYEGVVLPVILLLGTISKLGAFGFLVHLIDFILIHFPKFFSSFFLLIGLAAIVVGTISALYQFNLNRFLAYSTIANMGYVIIAFSNLNVDGLIAGIVYMIFYVIINLTFLVMYVSIYDNKKKRFFDNIEDLKLIKFNNIYLAVLMSLSLMSFAGIPPTLGFFAKYYLLATLIENKFFGLSILIIFFSCISAFYYLRLVKFIFFIKDNEMDNKSKGFISLISDLNANIISFLLMLNILCIVFIDSIISFLKLFLFF